MLLLHQSPSGLVLAFTPSSHGHFALCGTTRRSALCTDAETDPPTSLLVASFALPPPCYGGLWFPLPLHTVRETHTRTHTHLLTLSLRFTTPLTTRLCLSIYSFLDYATIFPSFLPSLLFIFSPVPSLPFRWCGLPCPLRCWVLIFLPPPPPPPPPSPSSSSPSSALSVSFSSLF